MAIAQFDNAKKQVSELTGKMVNLVVTDKDSRDLLFHITKDANRIRTLIDTKRLELTLPFRDEKKRMMAAHDKDKEFLNDQIKMIDTYAKDIISNPLEIGIKRAKNVIMDYDAEVSRRKFEIQKKLDDDRLEAEKLAEEAEEAAKQKNGIAGKIAVKVATEQKAEAIAVIENQRQELNAKPKGREVEVFTWGVLDLNKVPDKFIIKKINNVAIQEAIEEGVRVIPGVKIRVEKELKFQ